MTELPPDVRDRAAQAAAPAPEDVDAQIDAAFLPPKPPPVTTPDLMENLIRSMRDSDAPTEETP